jgi:PAS domain S-box-containing protein
MPRQPTNPISHQRAEEMLRLVLDTIPQHIFWKDRESVYLGCNRNFARVAGVDPPEAIVGRTDFDLPWRRGEAEFFRTVDQRVMANDRAELHIIEPQRQADGRHAWLDTSKVPIHDEDGTVVGILGAFEDITARIHREREQETLLTVARALRTASTRTALVDEVLKQVVDLLDTDGICFVSPTVDGVVRVEQALGLWAPLVGTMVAREGGSLTDHVLDTRRPYLNNDVGTDERLARSEIVNGTPALAGVPLVAEDEALGVLWIGRDTSIGRDDVRLLRAIADMTASALRREGLHDHLRRSHALLRDAYESTLEGWARALELRDGETEGHTRRVAEFTVQLARRMGFAGDDLADLRRGALLHDIGKMAIPDAILRKPGPLTQDEWAIMRQHPEYARSILEPIEFLHGATLIPYAHHERWDGSGYPQGLRGEEIPFPARVFAVVDVWDAVRSDRPYRPAWSAEAAVEYVEANSGVLFDPGVVPEFLRIVADHE